MQDLTPLKAAAAIGLAPLLLLAAAATAAQQHPPMRVSHVPATVYTAIEGSVIAAGAQPAEPMIRRDYYSWLFHLVLQASGDPVRIEGVTLDFLVDGTSLWSRHYPRVYLENLTWLDGALEYSTDYFLDNITFIDNRMESVERPTTPDVPAGGAVTWARIQEEQPSFALADTIRFAFSVSTPTGGLQEVMHEVPLTRWQQQVRLALPFTGAWLTRSGNDLATGHRRTGLNGVTTYAWDFMALGEDGTLFRTDGATPEDYHTYDAPVLAAASGTVVHVRNDIPDFGIGVTPPREMLEADGDVFAGNLVVIDHGNGEYTLTSHMKRGSIPVKIGDHIETGAFLGRVGNSGASMVPHIHINMMDGPDWLAARGVPAVFSNFTRVGRFAPDERIELGNPMSGWVIKPAEP